MRPLLRIIHSTYRNRKHTSNILWSLNQASVVTPSSRQQSSHHDGYTRNGGKAEPGHNKSSWPKALAVLGSGGVTILLWSNRENVVQALSLDKQSASPIAHGREAKKVFTRQEVSRHDCLDKGVWITYKGNVYDITNFIKHHPGGSHTIMMGAGGDVEPFWQTYTVHHANEVQNLLGQYQIGVLDPVELAQEIEAKKKAPDEIENDPYWGDPKRSPLLEVLSQRPFNAETPGKLLPPTYLTPVEVFFVRNHLPVPEVDPDEYRLQICLGSDGKQDDLKQLAELTLADLKTKFKPHSVDSIVQCSGNRRSDLKKIKEIKGLNWKVGAIGNARWTGVKLLDVLKSLGIEAEEFNGHCIKHIQMEGLDCDMSGQSYGASISSDLVFDPARSVLLAYEMNGQPLTRDHGFPIRLVAPGVTGARNVKWLGRIILSSEESHSHWQRKDYKSFSPNIDMFNLNFDESASVQETPVQSAICDPQDGDEMLVQLVDEGNGTLPVSGYAFSGGGKMIIRVDVSTDGGQTWITAKLLDVPKQADGLPDYTARNHTYSWTRWSIDVPIPEEILASKAGDMSILCRAFDTSYNSQPERPETVWNVRGVVNNSWHRIGLKLKIER